VPCPAPPCLPASQPAVPVHMWGRMCAYSSHLWLKVDCNLWARSWSSVVCCPMLLSPDGSGLLQVVCLVCASAAGGDEFALVNNGEEREQWRQRRQRRRWGQALRDCPCASVLLFQIAYSLPAANQSVLMHSQPWMWMLAGLPWRRRGRRKSGGWQCGQRWS
jgi:hypothetical protein